LYINRNGTQQEISKHRLQARFFTLSLLHERIELHALDEPHMHVNHLVVWTIAAAATASCADGGSSFHHHAAAERKWSEMQRAASYNDSSIQEGLEHQKKKRLDTYSMLSLEADGDSSADAALQRTPNGMQGRMPSWEIFYTGLKEDEGLDMTLEAAALVIFSLAANMLLFASCHFSLSAPSSCVKEAAVAPMNQDNQHPGLLQRTRRTAGSAVEESKRVKDCEQGISQQLLPQQKHKHNQQMQRQNTVEAFNQADRVIIKFMYGINIPSALDKPASANTHERMATSDTAKAGLQRPTPAFGQSLQNDLDRQSMLLSSASMQGFFGAAKGVRD
jgi:hypothetical protein